jgi:hypothetical protein
MVRYNVKAQMDVFVPCLWVSSLECRGCRCFLVYLPEASADSTLAVQETGPEFCTNMDIV